MAQKTKKEFSIIKIQYIFTILYGILNASQLIILLFLREIVPPIALMITPILMLIIASINLVLAYIIKNTS